MDSPTRRQFLATTGAGLAGILAAGVPPARGQQREVSYLCWNNFAPASDKKLAEIGQRFTKDTGIKIRIDHIAAPQQAAKYASEVQTQAGHDIVEMRMHFPWLYEPQLVDLGDIVGELEKKYGKALSSATETAKVNGVWRAVPQYRTFLVAADGINHHRSLAGANGQRHETDVPRHIGIWKFSKNVEPAKEWIRYLLGKKEVYDEYIMSGDAFNLPAYTKLQDHPVLKTDPKFAALKQEGVQFHCYGWPAPASDKVQLITNSFILPNMVAKAVTGTPTKEAVAWADKEMKKVMAG